eukprot:4765507-Prymnesium_polylepis.1
MTPVHTNIHFVRGRAIIRATHAAPRGRPRAAARVATSVRDIGYTYRLPRRADAQFENAACIRTIQYSTDDQASM